MEILYEINHETLVKCYYSFADHVNYYFVMEFLGGGDTKILITNYKLRDEVVKLLIAEITIALNNIHNLNITHKDIKPENILITNNVKVFVNI